MSDKQAQVIDVIAKVSKKDRTLIKPDSELLADLGIDSPKGLQLLMDLEEQFKVEIGDEDAAKMVTVKDLVTFISARS